MARIELSYILYGVIFMFTLNTMLGIVIDTSQVGYYDEQKELKEITEELGLISSTLANPLFIISNLFLDLIGVNVIAYISFMPAWYIGALGVYNIVLLIMIIMYLVDRLWVG